MRKTLVPVLILGLAIGLFAIVGCGEKKTTVETPFGDVEVSKDNGDIKIGDENGDDESVTIKTEEGDVTYKSSDKAPTEAELGVPIYPGAEYVPGSGGTASAKGEDGEFVTAGAEFTSDDGFDKVVDFYTKKLGSPMVTTSEGGANEAIWMKVEGEATTTVSVTEEDGGVSISIGRLSGM